MQKLYVLTGIPASGKSTWAKENINNDTKWISSDKLREELLESELDQSQNGLIFNEMRIRTRKSLREGYNVIYDATNIKAKERKSILKYISDVENIEKVCIVFPNNLNESILRNCCRKRKVPINIVIRMSKRISIPTYEEGWNKIIHIK